MNIINQTALGSYTSDEFTVLAGQTISIDISAVGNVDVQRKSGQTWVSLLAVSATGAYVTNGNFTCRIQITSNTGLIEVDLD